METIKVFLSSRVNSEFAGISGQYTLSDLRRFIRNKLESEHFLGKHPLEVLINEESFTGSLTENAFNNCMRELRSAHIIIILYNGEAGWSVEDSKSTNGICHEEALVAMNEFSDMSFIIDLSRYATLPEEGSFSVRNQNYTRDIAGTFPNMPGIEARDFNQLKDRTLAMVQQYILSAIGKAMATQKRMAAGSNTFGDTLDWSKLTYSERKEVLDEQLQEVFEPMPGFSEVYKCYHGIPDNMSGAEARNMIGRPFLYEHSAIQNTQLKKGIIHFVGVYGNLTGSQAKNLVGYPDITVIKAPFGVYLWEKNMHIQMFFLKGCINPQTIKTRYSEVIYWLNGSREQSNIIGRAAARYDILEVINRVHV
ncbi:MAG: hypothetical protein M3O71_15585 [Bacteroidota bacterium]|nr:hypothetical protein [Bacteroidota bacterium]